MTPSLNYQTECRLRILSFCRFYPFVKIVSCLFLVTTLFIYSVVPGLLNHYTRLMRHYVVSFTVAFMTMAITNLSGDLTESLPEVCKCLGLYT